MRTLYLTLLHVLALVGALALAFVVLVAPGYDATREEQLLRAHTEMQEQVDRLQNELMEARKAAKEEAQP